MKGDAGIRIIAGVMLAMLIPAISILFISKPAYGVELNIDSSRIVYARPSNITIDSYGGSYSYMVRGIYFTLDSSGNVTDIKAIAYCITPNFFSWCLGTVQANIYDGNGNVVSSGFGLIFTGAGSTTTVTIGLSSPVDIGNVSKIEVITGSGYGGS